MSKGRDAGNKINKSVENQAVTTGRPTPGRPFLSFVEKQMNY